MTSITGLPNLRSCSMIATRQYVMIATCICIRTAFSDSPQKDLTRRCCLIHLKSTALILIVLGIEIGLFYAVCHGTNWARKILRYLIIMSPFLGAFGHFGTSLNPPLLLLLFFLYLFVMYFLFLDKCFKKFFDSRRKKD